MRTIHVQNVESTEVTFLEAADLEAVYGRLEGLASTSSSHTASLAQHSNQLVSHDVSLSEIVNELAEHTAALNALIARIDALHPPTEPPPIPDGNTAGIGQFGHRGVPHELSQFNNPLFGWAELEPQPGIYNWTPVDNAVAAAESVGKFSIVRFYSDMRWFGTSTPTWVRDMGAAGVFTTEGSGVRTEWVPDPRDPIYRQRFTMFLTAANERYKNRRVVFQIMSGGSYGEWVFGDFNFTQAQKKDIIQAHIDMFRDAFPTSNLIIPTNGFSGDNWPIYEKPLLEYASGLGYWIGNYNGGFRSDGTPQGTPQPWLRDLINELSPRIMLERESQNGKAATLAEGFDAYRSVDFAQYPSPSFFTFHEQTFTDAETRAWIPENVIDRLKVM